MRLQPVRPALDGLAVTGAGAGGGSYRSAARDGRLTMPVTAPVTTRVTVLGGPVTGTRDASAPDHAHPPAWVYAPAHTQDHPRGCARSHAQPCTRASAPNPRAAHAHACPGGPAHGEHRS